MTTNETGPLGLERLENLEDYIEDILLRKALIPTSEQIGMLAAKRKPLKVASEVKAIERQIKTKCRCHHMSGHVIAGICYFGRCRHSIHAHLEGGS